MHFLLNPEVQSTLLVMICTGMASGLVMLFRIGSKVGETKTKVDTLWNYWLLHVSKVQLPKDDAPEKTAGFTP